jgi:DNA polymerase-3 subunit alpha
MDFLGLRNLTILENALKIIKKTTGDEIDIEKIPLDDEVTYQLLQQGETTGIFQLESAGMKRYLKQLKPTVFEDIIAMVALYRPGPMEWIPDFIAGKHGKKKVTYLHPKLEPILNNTYGVAVYQEQVMEIAKEIALFSGGEADNLRKVMGKKIVEKIAGEKKKFIEGAVKNGLNKQLAEKIFAFIEPFAGYGFNRSHAACYALIGYQTAYLKAHYPTQFMAALMNSDKNDIDRIAIEIEEAREMNIEVLPPNVNESFKDFAVVSSQSQNEDFEKTQSEKLSQGEFLGSIRFGLEAIKGVGEHIAQELIKEREKRGQFKDVVDLVERVQDKDLNKKSLEALAMSGALDSLIERNQLLHNVETVLRYAKDFQKNATSGQSSLFSMGEEESSQQLAAPRISLEEVAPSPKNQRLRWEKALLGLYISDHPLRGYQDYFTAKATPISKLDKHHINQNITVGGIIEKIQKINTRSGQTMLFVTLEDGLGRLELLVFPKVLEKDPQIWETENIILAKGKLSNKDNELKLLCEEGLLVNEEELKKYQSNPDQSAFKNGNGNGNGRNGNSNPTQRLKVILTEDINQEKLLELHQILSTASNGDCLVTLSSPEEDQFLQTPLKITPKEEILTEVKKIFGNQNVKLD